MPKVEVPLYQPDVALNAESSVSTSIFCGWLLARFSHKVLSPVRASLRLIPYKKDIQPAQRKEGVHIPTKQTSDNLQKAVQTCISWF